MNDAHSRRNVIYFLISIRKRKLEKQESLESEQTFAHTVAKLMP